MPYTGYGDLRDTVNSPIPAGDVGGLKPAGGFQLPDTAYATSGGSSYTTSNYYTPPTPIDPSLQAFQDLFNAAVIGPNQAIANQQTGNLQDQMALIMAGGDLQSQMAQQAADFSLAGLGLQQQNLGINQDALNRQAALLPQQFALTNQGYDLQEEQSKYGAGVSRRNLDNSYTARGAYTSEGANAGRGDIQSQLDFALRGIGLNRQGSELSHQEQMAQLGDAQKQLGISAKQLGLNGDEIRARLQNALQQIGISSMMNVDQLLAEMYKVQQGQVSPISGLFGDIYSLSGVAMPGGSTGSSGGVKLNQ